MFQICSEPSEQSNLQWFCELHPAANRDETVQAEINRYTKENKLLDAMREMNPNASPNEYIDLLWMVARINDESVANEISTKFGNVLQSLVINNISNEKLIEGACIIIGLISCSADEETARNSLFNSGVIDILVSCLKVHSKNNVIVQRTCKALTNVCFHSVQPKLCFLENGGLTILLTILKGDTASVPAKRCCAQLLRTIVHLNDENHHTLLLSAETPIENVVRAMGENTEDALTMWHFLWTVLNFSINQRHAKKDFGKLGVCQLIIQVMKLYPGETYLQQTAITTLRQLATIVSNRMILAREEFPSVLVDLMGQPSSTPSLIITILETLRRLCLTGLNRKLLATSPLLSKFREVAKVHIDNAEIANVALSVLANLAHGANATRQGLKDNGIIEFLNSVMVKHHNNSELVHDAYEIAHIIPHEGDVAEETSSESQTESDDEDYSGDDDVSKYINELKTVDTQSITLDMLKATQRTQETEIANLRKQIEEKEDVSKRYTKRISELTKEIESQYDSSKETILIQNSNGEITQDLDEKRKQTNSLTTQIENFQEQYDEANNRYLLLDNEESEENKKTEDIVNKLKEKIAKKKQLIQDQQVEIGKFEDIKHKVVKAEELFEESKSHLLTWIQLAIKLEGLVNGNDEIYTDKDALQQRIQENFLLGLGSSIETKSL